MQSTDVHVPSQYAPPGILKYVICGSSLITAQSAHLRRSGYESLTLILSTQEGLQLSDQPGIRLAFTVLRSAILTLLMVGIIPDRPLA